jgi:hypothetical protein
MAVETSKTTKVLAAAYFVPCVLAAFVPPATLGIGQLAQISAKVPLFGEFARVSIAPLATSFAFSVAMLLFPLALATAATRFSAARNATVSDSGIRRMFLGCVIVGALMLLASANGHIHLAYYRRDLALWAITKFRLGAALLAPAIGFFVAFWLIALFISVVELFRRAFPATFSDP